MYVWSQTLVVLINYIHEMINFDAAGMEGQMYKLILDMMHAWDHYELCKDSNCIRPAGCRFILVEFYFKYIMELTTIYYWEIISI